MKAYIWILVALCFGLSVLSPASAQLTSINWGGSVDSDWDKAENWQNNNIPDAVEERARIRASTNPLVELDSAKNIEGLEIGATYDANGTPTAVLTPNSALSLVNNLQVGYGLAFLETDAKGGLIINGGTHSVGGQFVIGYTGTGDYDAEGEVTMNGGSLTLADTMRMAGREGASADTEQSATMTMNGGTVTSTLTTGDGLILGQHGSATLTMNGGSVEFIRPVRIADQAGSSGTLRLNGGTFQASTLNFGAGTSVVEIGQGVLLRSGNQTASDGWVNQTLRNHVVAIGGIEDDSVLRSTYPVGFNQFESNGYSIRYGHDGGGATGLTAIWAVPAPSTLGLSISPLVMPDPNTMNLILEWDATIGITYRVYASTSIPGGWSQIDEIQATSSREALPVNYATSTVPRRFFQVAQAGYPIPDLNPWGVINVPIEPGMNFIGVPVWLEEAGISMNLNGANSVGNLLAGMLHSSDKLHIWTEDAGDYYWEELIRSSGEWRRPNSNLPTVSVLERGRGFIVERVDASATYLTFVAPVGNRNDRSLVITHAGQGWNPISLSEGRSMTIQSAFHANKVIFGSPQGAGNARFADRVIELLPDGTLAILSHQTDGSWLLSDQSGQSNGNGYVMLPGRAYFYERKAASAMEVQF